MFASHVVSLSVPASLEEHFQSPTSSAHPLVKLVCSAPLYPGPDTQVNTTTADTVAGNRSHEYRTEDLRCREQSPERLRCGRGVQPSIIGAGHHNWNGDGEREWGR